MMAERLLELCQRVGLRGVCKSRDLLEEKYGGKRFSRRKKRRG